MPSKSKYGKRKYRITSKRRTENQRSLNSITRQPIPTQVSIPPSPGNKVDSKISTSAPSEALAADKYAYVFDELKEIGILTSIILVILIVLALVLR